MYEMPERKSGPLTLSAAAAEWLGVERETLVGWLRFARWTPERLLAELQNEGWAKRLKEELDDAARVKAEAEAGNSLKGPAAIQYRRFADLVGMIQDPRLAALAVNYDPDKDGGRLVLGPTAVGKSVTGMAVSRRLHETDLVDQLRRQLGIVPTERTDYQRHSLKRGVTYWCRAQDLPIMRLQTPLGEGEAEGIRYAKSRWFLWLDDLGWESNRAGAGDVVTEVIAERYDSGLPMYVTSGLTLEAFTEKYGDAIVRRIVEAGSKPGAVVNLWQAQAIQGKPSLKVAK